MTEEKKDESKKSVIIKNADLIAGFYACLHNAENFLKSAKTLETNEDFQSSIPLATISMEESLKGLELLTRFRHDEDLTEDIWNDMKNHKHKLTHVTTEALEELKKGRQEDLEKAKEELAKTGIKIDDIDVTKLISNLQKRAGIHSHFQELREGCFYVDWDKLRGKWMLFDELPKDSKSKLAYYAICEAELTLNFLKMGIERYVNRLRETGQLLEKLPYPSYTEHRPVENFESNSLQDPRKDKADFVKYEKGLEIMQHFIDQKSFEFLAFGVYRRTMLEYLQVLGKQNPEQWFPHPMIKAIMMASSKTHELQKEGKNIAAISDDSDVTYEGKPMMVFNVIAKLQSGVIELVNVTEVSQNIECQGDLIEKIIRTEKIIERQQGKDISTAIFIEAISSVGIKVKMIKSDEIPDAIRVAKEYATAGKIQGREEMNKQILAIRGSEEWNEIVSDVRALICQVYGHQKYPGYNMYMTPTDEIRKSKCRQIIFMTLTQEYLKTA